MLPALFALALSLSTHSVGVSRGVYVVDGGRVDVELTFARPELLRLADGVDVDHDGTISAPELAQGHAHLAERLQSHLGVRRGDHACSVIVGALDLVEEDGVVAGVTADCGAGPGDIVVDFGVVDLFAAGHRHLAQVAAGAVHTDAVAFVGHREFTLAGSQVAPPVAAYLGLGVEHILLGYDHLVFLLGVLIVLLRAGTLRSVVGLVTAFTVAHSITLAIAATATWVPPSAPIEILIAVSIVAVGIEAIFASSTEGRWTRTFFFGLIHGFGFAGALAEIGLPKQALVPALFLFNVGVEGGQLAVVAVLAPLLLVLRRRLDPRRASRLVVAVAVAVVAAGFVWFVERAVAAAS